MKRLSVISLLIVNCSLLIVSLHASPVCRKTVTCADLKTAWNNDTTQLTAAYPDGYGYGAGYENVPWTISITSSPSGTMSGIAKCTGTSGTAGQAYTDATSGAPSNGGQYCWCKLTGMTSATNACYGGAGAPWASVGNYYNVSASYCQSDCALNCAYCALDGTYINCRRSVLLQGVP